jgi:diguanylate cyclase (GGDEF)-like protein/PAS domain S-box-containing protein
MITRHRRLLNALGVVLILTMCAVVALLLHRSRDRAMDDLRRDTKNLTSALALYTRGVVASIDLALVGGRDSLTLLEVTGGKATPGLAAEMLRNNVASIGLPVLMRVLDADGYQRFSSDPQPWTQTSSDRDFFKAHVARDAGLYISQPFVSRINGKWAIVFSRRLNGPGGEFKGIIQVGAPMEVFEDIFQRFEVGARGTLILADDNGILLARRPANPELVAKKVLRDDGALGQLRSGVNAGVRINTAPVDGLQRMLGFERVASTRLVVGVGQSVDDWLAKWRREAFISGTVTVLFGGVALFMLLRTTQHAKEAAQRTEQLERSEDRIRSILANAPDAFIGIDQQGRITDWNRQAQHTFGWTDAQALGRSLAELLIPPRMRDSHTAGLSAFASTGTGPVIDKRIELTALHRDGREIPVEVSVAALPTPSGYVANAFLHDISERKEAAARLALVHRRLRDITDNLPLLVSYVDKDRRLRFCNATWREWLGVDPTSATGHLLEEVIGPTLYEQRRESLDRALGGERVSFDVESVALGINRFLHTVYVPDLQPDGTVAGIYAVSTDVTASKKVEIQLQDLAHADSLTGLPNRRRFEERLQEAVARSRRDQRPMALMFLDVDHFKRINDTLGHAGGDAVLREFARRLARCIRATDTAARFAGDEFVVILEGLHDGEDANVVAGNIVAELQPPFVFGDKQLSVTTSIGIAIFSGEHVSADVAVAKADEALYRAKDAGRNTFVVSSMDFTEMGGGDSTSRH